MWLDEPDQDILGQSITIRWLCQSWVHRTQINDVSPDWRGTILTRRQRHDDEVHLQRRRHTIASRYSQWWMRIILLMALHHRQSIHAWILLANSQGWHNGSCHKVQRLPVLPKANIEACKSSLTYWSLLPLCNLGNRHCGHLAQGTRRIQISICHSWHLHQVDGGNASSEYHARSSDQVLAECHI
jgi:hypothetical protein